MAYAQLPMPVLDALPLGAHLVDASHGDSCEGVLSGGSACLTALTDEALFRAVGVRIAFTNREGGVSEGPYASLNCALHVDDDPAAVTCNHRIVLQAIGAPHARLIVPNQVHGTHVVCVGAVSDTYSSVREPRDEVAIAQREASEGADAVVVGVSGVAALMNFADCLPLILVAPDGSFAVAHAGWRGAVARVASKAALALADMSGLAPHEFNAYIGPHIRSECFEVGGEVAQAFEAVYGCVALPDKCHVSLANAVTADLMGVGLDERRIADAHVCTKCSAQRYFSYRAENGVCGRHAAVAVRVERG